ncbi:MAG: AbgT family transporter, partial [Clostridia bacterium]|nr:AbgT family transporter [Clostridia bacterium]
PVVGSLIIYLIIIVFNMFIPSGSAKAVLLMPIIFELCSLSGIHPQVAVLAFAFGDGFSNVILPTNAGLLLILGMTTVDYGKWFRWSFKIQLALLSITALVLVFAQLVYYA